MEKNNFRVMLAGNPNVGKSTLFNLLTRKNQHTGNWTGKTVDFSTGLFTYNGRSYSLTDLPGAYSLLSFSPEEAVTRDHLLSESSDCVIIVLDATAVERNLRFALEVLSVNQNAVICLNMTDECEKNGIFIDSEKMSAALGVSVVKTSAAGKKGIALLLKEVEAVCEGNKKPESAELSLIDLSTADSRSSAVSLLTQISKRIIKDCVTIKSDRRNESQQRLDKLLTSKSFGIPAMMLLTALLFWITLVGANYPSEWLSALFALIKSGLNELMSLLKAPEFLRGLLIDGVYTTLSWVVSVMLPPMAIFFPLFALIEESGYLPRIAFNADSAFAKCGVNGKQCLTMMMGIGCNACGVEGCRIIHGRKERLIAILTNTFMPCNGRFPILIALIAVFFSGGAEPKSTLLSVLILMGITTLCVAMTLLVSKLLSRMIGGDSSSGFILELPPYRKPRIIKTIVNSLRDKALKVLGRAMLVAAPAGAVIWLTANISINGSAVLDHCVGFLEPFGKAIGVDGVILIAFILGFPANETVIPAMLMAYTQSGTLTDYSGYGQLSELFSANGWTALTAVCVMIITVFHFPCSTTCLTIRKETRSLKWTLAAFLLPTALGILLCAVINCLYTIFA